MSPKFEKVKHYYDTGLWGESAVRKAAAKGWITQAECDLILNGNAEEGEQDEAW